MHFDAAVGGRDKLEWGREVKLLGGDVAKVEVLYADGEEILRGGVYMDVP